MKACEWIDRVKAAKGIDSDYGVAKYLHVTPQAVSGYRSKTPTMNEDTAIKVALALGVEPVGVLIDQIAEQTKNPAARTALFDVSRRLSILCKLPETVATQFIAACANAACAAPRFS